MIQKVMHFIVTLIECHLCQMQTKIMTDLSVATAHNFLSLDNLYHPSYFYVYKI